MSFRPAKQIRRVKGVNEKPSPVSDHKIEFIAILLYWDNIRMYWNLGEPSTGVLLVSSHLTSFTPNNSGSLVAAPAVSKEI